MVGVAQALRAALIQGFGKTTESVRGRGGVR
jgi:hypothetical protein